jgi:monovalent cation:proton antiporter-2 (CPA2) family protein
MGLSAVLGYLAAGVIIGPSVLGLVGDPATIATVAEFGVVLLLFIVGLELKLSHLWDMRRNIFGLGFAQLAITAVIFGGLAHSTGISPGGSFVVGIALALSATAIALQMLGERNDLPLPYGQRSFSILLFQDLSIVPILAVLPLLATGMGTLDHAAEETSGLIKVIEAVAAIAAVVVVGRYGLNPFFRILARTGAREVLTASALLVVLGAALLMEEVGLSMAMGAFLAGLLLAESNFRHQLEADIEPFRGMLLGLFFMSVGMSIDLALVRDQWLTLLIAAPAVVVGKTVIITLLSRLFGASWSDGIRSGILLCPAGEFAFVLLPVAAGLSLLSPTVAQLVTALAAITMLIGPLLATLLEGALSRAKSRSPQNEGAFAQGSEDLSSRVLVIGFGRFGQIVNQMMLARGIDVTVIDNDVERIRDAARFGLRVYYGDGTRLDVLRAAGAEKAEMICICIDEPASTVKIVEIMNENFPTARSFVRAYDRVEAIRLMGLDVDYQLRECFESAIAFGRAALEELGADSETAAAVMDDVRKRDIARMMLQKAGGNMGGAELMVGAKITPEPLLEPAGKARALNAETRDILGEGAL